MRRIAIEARMPDRRDVESRQRHGQFEGLQALGSRVIRREDIPQAGMRDDGEQVGVTAEARRAFAPHL